MYKNVLIISDNSYLCHQFEQLLMDDDFFNISWTFAISPFSNIDHFNLKSSTKLKVFDLKTENTVNTIMETYDLVFSVHCKQFFPKNLVRGVKCINVHPGYNPINRGWYPQVFAIINDLQVGATIHEIDEKLDHGAIIARALVEKEIVDTSETLYNKIIAKELVLLKQNLKAIVENTYKTFLPENEGNLFLKKDFENLCHLKNDEKMTTIEFVNRIRALTHGDFKNAFIVDSETGHKIYLSINLDLEN